MLVFGTNISCRHLLGLLALLALRALAHLFEWGVRLDRQVSQLHLVVDLALSTLSLTLFERSYSASTISSCAIT